MSTATTPAELTAAVGAPPAGSGRTYEIAGRTVTMPVRVRSARMAAATYLVDAEAAQSIIERTGLTVARKRTDRAIVALALVRYVDSDLGDYNELGLTFVVDDPAGAPPTGRGSVATYIHRLPVNQAFTCAAGQQIWGFPKWVSDLDVSFGPTGASAVLRGDDGQQLVRVDLAPGRIPTPSRPMEMVCYSNGPDDEILRTSWVTHNRGSSMRPRGATVEIGNGHVLCDEMRTLGLGDRQALLCAHAQQMRATFSAPEVVVA